MNFIDNFEKYKIDLIENGVKLPNFDTGNVSPDKFLLDLCIKGLDTRLGGKKHPKYKEYYERMSYELGVLNELGFCEYLLITWDIINFCKKNNIATGYGRGSAAGSIVLWLVGVTEIDSLKYDLYFERFLNKTRAKFKEIDGTKYYAGSLLFDVDLDISFSDRYKVVDYLNEKYKGKTAKLLTVSTLTTKILLKEVCKSYLEYSEEEANEISEMILKEHGKVKSIKESAEKSADFKRFYQENAKVVEISGRLSELIKNCGIHPSACIINHCDISESFPLQLTKEKEIVTGYTMDDSLELAIKVDILGIRAATLLNEACKMLNLDINKIDLNDKIIYDNLQNLITPHGLFQIEAETNYRVLQKVKPKNLDHLAAIVSLARPGVLQFTDQYAKYVETGEFQSVHPFFDDILKSTAGIPLYQESLLTMAKKIGFSLVEGETLRRLVGKKKLEEVKEWQAKIENKIKENNLDPKIGEEFWKLLEASANYSFNACLSPDTVVETEDGFKMLFEIKNGEKVKAYNVEKNEDHFVKVINKHENKVELYEIELEDGRKIKASMDHKFMCEDKKMRPLKEIISNKHEIMCK